MVALLECMRFIFDAGLYGNLCDVAGKTCLCFNEDEPFAVTRCIPPHKSCLDMAIPAGFEDREGRKKKFLLECYFKYCDIQKGRRKRSWTKEGITLIKDHYQEKNCREVSGFKEGIHFSFSFHIHSFVRT